MSRILPLLSLLSAWFDRFRWRELGGIVSAAWFGGLQLAQTVNVPAHKQHQVAFVLAFAAAGCYVLNPKYAAWVEVVQAVPAAPVSGQDSDAQKIGFRYNVSGDAFGYDPYANSSDEEVRNA